MKQVRIGVIGAGMRSIIAKHWHQPEEDSIVVGVADLVPENLTKFQEIVNADCFVTTDYKELLGREGINAIVITSPDHLHEEHAIAALEAGKHVYCEKPLAITEEGCDRIIATSEKTGKHLMVGFNMRYMNMFQKMKEIVDAGEIGDVKAVWVRHFVGRGGYYYYLDWHGLQENTTSLLLQKGSHDIDIIHWIAGAYTKKVSAFGGLDFFGDNKASYEMVHAENSGSDTKTKEDQSAPDSHAFRQEIDVEDNNVVIMELENGIKASYLQCHFTPDYHRNYTFIGTKGRMENSEPKGEVYVKKRDSYILDDYSEEVYDIENAEGGHGGADPVIAKEFVNLVLHNKQPIPTTLDGRMSVATGCAAAASMRNNGKMVEVARPEK